MIRQAATIALPRLRNATTITPAAKLIVVRTLVTKAPGADPLEVFRKDCLGRKFCDEDGYRQPGVHWVFAFATAPSPDGNSDDGSIMPPNLRTVGIQKVGPAGIDFVTKAGSKIADTLAQEQPVSILHAQGTYKPGCSAQQWRGDGHCEKIPLADILHCLPQYTVTGMLVAKRIVQESLDESGNHDLSESVSADRLALLDKSHVTEITQRTRLELENNEVSQEELEASIQAFRFCPDRLERMHGGPDSIMWERWEWMRNASGENCPEGSIPWNPPNQLLPH